MATLSTICWSPRPRRPKVGIPRPRSVITVPGWVPAGTSISSSPSSVGTLTVVPSAAAGAGTSTTLTRSLPSRRKRSSSPTLDHHVEVPGRPAQLAAWPRPERRMRWSSAMPAGMSTVERLAHAPGGRVRRTPCRAREGIRPSPPQALAHVLAHELAERRAADRSEAGRCPGSAARRISEPGSAPLPLQRSQASTGRTPPRRWRPWRPLERDLHGHRHVAALHPAAGPAPAEAPKGSPPKKASKMSENEPKPLGAEREAARVEAVDARSGRRWRAARGRTGSRRPPRRP